MYNDSTSSGQAASPQDGKAHVMRNAILVSFFGILLVSISGCDKPLAYGDPHAIIVVSSEDVWPALEDSVLAVLSPDVFTLRNERTFRVTYQVPEGIEWQRLRKFKETVLIGGADDPWMAEALAAADDPVDFDVPGIVEVENVWANGQNLTIMVVDPARDVAPQVFGLLHEAHRIIDQRFREGARRRMFVSGIKDDLADSLQEAVGFSLLLPEVYRWEVTDSFFIFRNDNPSPGELIRQFGVTWRTPIPTDLTTDSLLAWKEAVSVDRYAYPQTVDLESIQTREMVMGNMEIREIRGAWSNPPGSQWPAAGPFVFWSVACPGQDRLYFLDSWLYAPGKDKWEYIIQLETILGSFRCGTESTREMQIGD